MVKKNLSFYWKFIIKPRLIVVAKNCLNKRYKGIKEQNWGLYFYFAIQQSKWFKNTSLNPGRWSLGFPSLYALFRVLNEVHPKNILEFGLGESSKLTYQYHDFAKDTTLTIIEQDENWLKFFSQNIFNLNENTHILPIVEKLRYGKKVYAYKNLISTIQNHKYDFIIIDGPWGAKHYSRSQILDIVEADLLADDFVILFDDVNRYGERQTLELLFEMLRQKNVRFYKGIYWGEKEACIICSEKYKFLSSI